MKKWICKYCGGDTKSTDMDYLDGYDHISCILKMIDERKNKNVMKIKNWDKINGYTYKGYTIINPIYNTNGMMYYADVLNLNLSHKPKWHLELVIDAGGYKNNTLTLLDGDGMNIRHVIELVDIRTSALFRVRFEEIIDEMLSRKLTSASKGILNTITTNGNNVVYTNTMNGTTYTQGSIIDTIHELQKQINDLNAKLNTPVNPF